MSDKPYTTKTLPNGDTESFGFFTTDALAEPQPLTHREVMQQALEQVQEFKRRWWLVPAFGSKVNKATREAITNAHSPIFELEHTLRAALMSVPDGAEPQEPSHD